MVYKGCLSGQSNHDIWVLNEYLKQSEIIKWSSGSQRGLIPKFDIDKAYKQGHAADESQLPCSQMKLVSEKEYLQCTDPL
jgi:hypothetical protein